MTSSLEEPQEEQDQAVADTLEDVAVGSHDDDEVTATHGSKTPSNPSSPDRIQMHQPPPPSDNDEPMPSDSDEFRKGMWEEKVSKPSRKAIRDFFFPRGVPAPVTSSEEPEGISEEEKDRIWVEGFWRTYDDVIFISLFTQVGMVFRLAAAKWFAVFDDTFRNDSALFTTLPLNCLSCFLLGLFSDGKSLMQIVETRFTPGSLQHELQESQGDLEVPIIPSADGTTPAPALRQRRGQRQRPETTWTTPKRVGDAEFREVQLLALERRMRASPCLLLFPAMKEDVDVMEHYFDKGYQRRRTIEDLVLQEEHTDLPSGGTSDELRSTEEGRVPLAVTTGTSTESTLHENPGTDADRLQAMALKRRQVNGNVAQTPTEAPALVDRDLDQILQDVSTNITANIQDVSANITTNISIMRRVSLADGWDVGTTPEAMSDDLMLGIRNGFCGALSSFSSWNSTMVSLIKNGEVGEAVVGYMLGLQLPIVAYRFGQYLAMYIFIWRCRQENRTDEKRGYGIRVSLDDEQSLEDLEDGEDGANNSSPHSATTIRQSSTNRGVQEEVVAREIPSVRAIATALFVLATVTQLTSLVFFTEPEQLQIALSLLFSPLGVLARWRLSRWNRLFPGFPVGTFVSNMLSCALSGSLGRLVAGNPGPRERIVLVSIVSGFGGSLSSVASLILEMLAGMDPLLFRFDGFTYAVCTIFWGMAIGFLMDGSADWADSTSTSDP